MEQIWDEKYQCYRDEYGRRISNVEKETIDILLNFAIRDNNKGRNITLHTIKVLLDKSLEGTRDKRDLTEEEKKDIKRIRELIKGL